MSYYDKYLNYKSKYLKLKELIAGSNFSPPKLLDVIIEEDVITENSDEKNITTPIKKILSLDSIVEEENNEEQVKNGIWNKLPSELYVIGDVHGDFFALKQSLELTSCVNFGSYNEELKFDAKNELYYLNDGCDYYNINENVRWNPEKRDCFVVIAGDMTDRCRQNEITNPNCINTINDENCDYKIMKLLFDLDKEARKYNSRVIVVLGNHELFNIKNDLRYVSVKGKNDTSRLNNIKQLLIDNLDNIYGLVRINRYVIVHGGINDEYFKLFNNKYNKELNTKETIELYNKYIRILINKSIHENASLIDRELTEYSPFMDRSLGMSTFDDKQCDEIFVSNLLNIKSPVINHLKIIVAHCPQFIVNKNINLTDCNKYREKIYKIDVGMSRAFDFYKSFNLIKTNLFLFYPDMNPLIFYNIDNDKSRSVSILKIKLSTEEPIKGKLSIEYFYETAFKNNKDKIKYLFSDIKQIFKLNLNKLSIELDDIGNEIDSNRIILSNMKLEGLAKVNQLALDYDNKLTNLKKYFSMKEAEEKEINNILQKLNELLKSIT